MGQDLKRKLYGLDLFTGIGGITGALQEFVNPLAYCEIDPYVQCTLLQNMQKGLLPKAPIWDDILTLTTKDWPMQPDFIYGGSPCQDISVAGLQKGLEGERSKLIFEVFRLLDETQAPLLFLENVPNIRTKGAERVCKELAERGYDCRWCCLSASDVGAPHKRERWFLLAYSDTKYSRLPTSKIQESDGTSVCNFSKGTKLSGELEGVDFSDNVADSTDSRKGFASRKIQRQPTIGLASERNYWNETERPICGVAHGISHRSHRIKALGNSVVPQCARKAFEILMGIE